MKKLVLFFAAVLLTAISSNLFAQSTGTTPYPGATHTYQVTANGNATFVWKIYTTDGTNLTEVDATDPGIDAITPNNEQLSITWAAGAVVGTEYLVAVTETVTATSCSNTKALPVKITASTFDLIVAVNGGDKCYTNSVSIGWTGGQGANDVTYDHGDATIGCTVEGTGVGTTETWSFSLDLSYDIANINQSSVTVTDGSSNTVTPDANGIYTLTGPQTATVSIIVDNANSYNNNSAADAQDFTTTITLDDVASGTGAIESDGTNNTGDEKVARPNTSGITTN